MEIAIEQGLRRSLAEMTADRDRLAARLEVSDDPEMSPDKIDHLEGMLEFERKYAKRLAAELARVRSALATDLAFPSDDEIEDQVSGDGWNDVSIFARGWYEHEERIRAALAQTQDGTTEGRG